MRDMRARVRACVRACVCQISKQASVGIGHRMQGKPESPTHCILLTPPITIHPWEAFVSQRGRVIVIGRSNYRQPSTLPWRKCHQTEALFYLSHILNSSFLWKITGPYQSQLNGAQA